MSVKEARSEPYTVLVVWTWRPLWTVTLEIDDIKVPLEANYIFRTPCCINFDSSQNRTLSEILLYTYLAWYYSMPDDWTELYLSSSCFPTSSQKRGIFPTHLASLTDVIYHINHCKRFHWNQKKGNWAFLRYFVPQVQITGKCWLGTLFFCKGYCSECQTDRVMGQNFGTITFCHL